ncbi:tetratricopeptide repeat protein [Streptomyces triculaminicus]|uniref:Tetratricopeptide repeat protein n=3 Tax=Streptomyces TaxID=1883 RepID=A0A939FP85_9ACTN|nr:tetratricopeptide repeat protein [Streptomyces triculaminicus]MBO0654349.1 tetratricopeptide repeat protein [Streptomyces triculaminicus]
MPDESPLLKSLRAAVDAAPDDVPLRLHFAELLLGQGRQQEAITQLAAALQREPGNAEAQALMGRAVAPAVTPPATLPQPSAPQDPAQDSTPAPAPASAPSPAPGGSGRYDWQRAEDELSAVVPPRFVRSVTEETTEARTEQSTQSPQSPAGPSGPQSPLPAQDRPTGPYDDDTSSPWDVESGTLALADVGGMHEVKERLEAAFLAPMRNPELRRLYGKSLGGGLLMYGPPGCGKTYIARAVAGELGARFMSVSISDVLDMWMGNSERNLRQLFETARRNAPCVLFLDELDALGAKRSQIRHTGMRTTVNQLLTELDGVSGSADDGVFVLAATNHPWDVDTALRRPGRLDRMLLVLPPDQPAREAILRHHLKDRPVAGIDLAKLAKRTDGFSGADLKHLCESAAERALMDSVRTGEARMIGMADFTAVLGQVRPSTGPWFASARNVAQFANEGGAYDELLVYLKKRKML